MYIPQELLLRIFSFVSSFPDSQGNLAACCLVCRSWHSAAVEYLYRAPQISNRNFRLFARTITGGRRRSALGKLVRRFNMAGLVHDSSNSLTARLLGNMKYSLEHFIAPACSLSTNGLLPLSKSQTLRTLDLSAVMMETELAILKDAFKNLDQLTSLTMPLRVTIRHDLSQANAMPWPPRLRKLVFSHIEIPGASIDKPLTASQTPLLSYPDTLVTLSCPFIRGFGIGPALDVLSDHRLAQTLRRLRLHHDMPHELMETDIFSHREPVLANLTFLGLPCSATSNIFDPLMADTGYPPLKLEILEFIEFDEPVDHFPVDRFIKVLDGALRNLRRLGLIGSWEEDLPEDLAEDLDEALQANAIKSGYDKEDIENGDIPVGLYFE